MVSAQCRDALKVSLRPQENVFLSCYEIAPKKRKGIAFIVPMCLPSVWLLASETRCWALLRLYIWDGHQRERKKERKEWMQNVWSCSKTTCQLEIEAIPFVPVSLASLIDICWWEFVLEDVLHFTSQGLCRYSLPSPPLYTPFPALRS